MTRSYTNNGAAIIGNGSVHSQASQVPAAAQNLVRGELTAHYALYERLARSRADTAAEAADIVQSFALKALERAGQLKDPCAVRGWLRRVFETSVIDHFRRRTKMRQREVSLEGVGAISEIAASQPSFGDEKQLLQSIMASLKSEYAEAICRVDLQDQTTEEIAGGLGITVNNLGVRIHRARSAFRSALDRRPIHRSAARPVLRCGAYDHCRQAHCPLEMVR
jgi:RNA polymerase sigma-70 factor (ECF subfamily)